MKIKSVEMMRSIRNQMSMDIQDMDWKEEQEYLNSKIQSFEFLTKQLPNTTLNSAPQCRHDFFV